ncbi:hypothetical protein L2Y94_03140 [Luteibacter aegosomatis]|uniref:hypothetical protein n=1 Tax=Luteibacter aegosomatis TaxID=2911537 RepID=UPI001FF884A4|nr:hypothetical protein [Luteibacter aegosomatis]UPG86370.1 hypothetical protein L2Y94_03140 [Luteibacter aegosomatis]
MKPSNLLSLSLILASTFFAGAAVARDRPQPLPDQQDAVAKSLLPCPGGLERFLPGDYYFCSAARNYWSGYPGMARESLKDAAAWASKPAQYALGIMYFNGDHADRNRPLGLAWLALAAERHDPNYEPAFISAYKSVTPDEMRQANAYWVQLKAKYADDVAAKRAVTRFDRAYREIAWAMNFGGSVFIDGLTMPDNFNPNGIGHQSGFSLARFLQAQKASYFQGYNSRVFVGEEQLVPISQVAPRAD